MENYFHSSSSAFSMAPISEYHHDEDTNQSFLLQGSGSPNGILLGQDHDLMSENMGDDDHVQDPAKSLTAGKNKGKKKVKKPKHAFQTRSHVDILDDGYRWRKYGQKAVKNNKFPRNYYKCTHQGCDVKKQVQRLTKDEGIVVTTYDGVHSHPIDKSNDTHFQHILSQMQIYNSSF